MSSALCPTQHRTSAYPNPSYYLHSERILPSFNGWNVSMIDSLDTMLLMGLHEEFTAALPIVQHGNFSEVRLLFSPCLASPPLVLSAIV